MRTIHLLAAGGIVFAGMSMAAFAQSPRPRAGELQVGDTAPDFTIKDVQGKREIRLSKLSGKPIVLIFGSCT